ncbi:MAG TPA: SDR family NAD(P)-dependent oxidoreductase [Acidimicrobiales bacterium]|jgi:NAD(P)-dependent dehydrogenase (short-subunit alcohol dehydrogenase family)|nr:SDR family NAD(P)-dependent oxidoreductase [Acidimicrobiales bacterium]
MELHNRVAVVTGGASGIGRALALAAAAEGARGVVVADLDSQGADAVAKEIEATGGAAKAVRCDVSVEDDVRALVATAESTYGPVDAFFANAGVLVGGGFDAPEELWDRAWSINVKSHIYAARAVVPGMLERGEGYLVHTASAAGLLMQLGAAPYTVSKHAIVSFAEYLSVTHHAQGLRVSCLCPQAVATNLGTTSRDVLAGREPHSEARPSAQEATVAAGPLAGTEALRGTAASDGVVTPERCAELVIEAMREERFLVLPHPEVATYEQHRAGDRERWLRGMRRAQAQLASFFSGDRARPGN